MGRRLRYVAKKGTLVEVTCRVTQGRMLMRPTKQINEMITGTLAHGKRLTGVRHLASYSGRTSWAGYSGGISWAERQS